MRAATRPAASSSSRRVPVPAPNAEPDYFPPQDGVAYPEMLRNSTYHWKRSSIGVVLGLSLFLLLSAVVTQAVILLAWVLTEASTTSRLDYYRAALAFERPSGMLGANLGIAAAIPIAALLMLMLHRVRPRWLASVTGTVRWRYLAACLAVAVLALGATLWLSGLVEPLPPLGAQPGFWGFLLVIVLTSPLQAAAEEILFRGYLMQALGSLVAAPWFGVVVSSVVFALLHGTQNLPLFLDRLAFGLLAAVLVWRTGGLEASIAAHIVNNVFAYLLAGLTTSIATIRGTREIGWVDAGFDVGGFALFAVLAYLVAQQMQVARQVGGLPGLRTGAGLQ
jgi:hypothetical protein